MPRKIFPVPLQQNARESALLRPVHEPVRRLNMGTAIEGSLAYRVY
jgi:hypothetical protein